MSLITAILSMMASTRQRNQLRALDAHLLRDIGLTRAQALAEADRPVWDAPAHWLMAAYTDKKAMIRPQPCICDGNP